MVKIITTSNFSYWCDSNTLSLQNVHIITKFCKPSLDYVQISILYIWGWHFIISYSDVETFHHMKKIEEGTSSWWIFANLCHLFHEKVVCTMNNTWTSAFPYTTFQYLKVFQWSCGISECTCNRQENYIIRKKCGVHLSILSPISVDFI